MPSHLDEMLGPPLLIVNDEEQLPRRTRIEIVGANGVALMCADDSAELGKKTLTISGSGEGSVPDVENEGDVLTVVAGAAAWAPTAFSPGEVISPTQLSANTDNWNPTGLATSRIIRVSTDASRNLTGITAAGGAFPYDIKRLINVGSFNLVLIHDATSTAANRFLIPGSLDLTLLPNDSVVTWYDPTTERWRVL